MIIGFGIDMVDIGRIEKMMAEHGERFMERCFTAHERDLAEKRRAGGKHIEAYAKRFAAKEACAKALGCGIDEGVYLKDIGVVNDENGAPSLALTGGALARLEGITPAGMKAKLHISLTDEPPMALAQVIIEALHS